MDFAAAFLFSVLGGYCFAYIWGPIAFTTKKAEGHHLYFRAALCGAVFFLIALALRIALALNSPTYLEFDTALVEYVAPALKEEPGLVSLARTRRAEWVVTAFYSLLLGTVCGVTANVFTPRRWSARRSSSELDRLLLDANWDEHPITLTLNTGKVYVGLVLEAPNPFRERAAVALLPLLSGNRDDEGRIQLTTDYEEVYVALNLGKAAQLGLRADWPSQFRLVVRADEIVTATRFSRDLYGEFNPDWQQAMTQQGRPTLAGGEEPTSDDNAPAFPAYVLSSMGTNFTFSGPT
jgi:hypothetical protein